MTGLQDFLAPFSHLLFANRNLVIVLVCAVAFWAAIQALKDRWRADRLERDLNSARSNPSPSPVGRRYASAPAEEPMMESGGALPPVKGGRTYARNLGTALQKAGMSSPQVYSPPTPAGFAPNTNPLQPVIGQPGPGYPGPSAPWGSAPPQPPGPWGFPGGGRNAPPPAPVPFYQPQPPGQPPSAPLPMPAQPAPNAGGSPMYGPPAAPPTFTVPQPGPFPAPAPTNAPQAPAPPFSPQPVAGPMMPSPPMPQMAPPPVEAEPADAARRGKPKRRRFNFNVLENLEKMVQQKPAESSVAPTAAAVPAAPTAPPAFTASPASAGPTVSPQPDPTPAPTTAAPTLPFLFGQPSEAKAAPATPTPEATAAAAPADTEEEKAGEAPAAAGDSEETLPFASSDERSAEPGTPARAAARPSEPKQEARRSMRSMMFGEEIASVSASNAGDSESTAESEDERPVSVQPEGEPTAAASTEANQTETAESETDWPSQPWNRREEANASAETTTEEPALALPEDNEPTLKPFGSYDPWKPAEESVPEQPATEADAWKSDAEEPALAEAAPALPETETTAAEAEPSVAEEAPVAADDAPTTDQPADSSTAEGAEAPPDSNGDRPSAGTLVIIEDDQTAASYYATLFKGHGYQVEVANDGVSGVDLCAKVQPQVILLDVMMPRQNGILVLQTLRASDETKNTPVVVMSNFSEPTLIKRALQLGALEYVIKTQVEGPALLNAVPRWMNREKAFAAA